MNKIIVDLTGGRVVKRRRIDGNSKSSFIFSWVTHCYNAQWTPLFKHKANLKIMFWYFINIIIAEYDIDSFPHSMLPDFSKQWYVHIYVTRGRQRSTVISSKVYFATVSSMLQIKLLLWKRKWFFKVIVQNFTQTVFNTVHYRSQL